MCSNTFDASILRTGHLSFFGQLLPSLNPCIHFCIINRWVLMTTVIVAINSDDDVPTTESRWCRRPYIIVVFYIYIYYYRVCSWKWFTVAEAKAKLCVRTACFEELITSQRAIVVIVVTPVAVASSSSSSQY